MNPLCSLFECPNISMRFGIVAKSDRTITFEELHMLPLNRLKPWNELHTIFDLTDSNCKILTKINTELICRLPKIDLCGLVTIVENLRLIVRATTNRFRANIIFVPSADIKEYLEFEYDDMVYQLGGRYTTNEIRFVVDSSLAPNEMSATYWFWNGYGWVDGGVRISKDTVAYNPNYKDYFVKIKWR